MATIDAATNTNAVALEPELPSATGEKIENEQQTLQQSDAKPGAALAAFSSSPLNAVSGVGSGDPTAQIADAMQSIMTDPEQVVSLMNQSLAATERMGGAGGVSELGIEGLQTPADVLAIQQQITKIQFALKTEHNNLARLGELKANATTPEEIAVIDSQIAAVLSNIEALTAELKSLFNPPTIET